MAITLSARVQNIKSSITFALVARMRELQNQGKNIINLALGEPDFATPKHIKAAANQAIKDNFTKYTQVDGIPSLKSAIINKFARENKLKFKPNQILVSAGAKFSFYAFCAATLNSGDEVIVPSPYWTSYPDMIKLCDGTPVILKTTAASNYKITPEQLEKAITPQTKMFLINSPNNPSGMVYSQQELTALASVLQRYPQILIVSDDIYEHIIWTKQAFTNILNCCPSLEDRTIIINGVSKTYAMTGWRIGYAAGNASIIAAMQKIQAQSTSSPNSIAQVAAEAALSGEQTCVEEMCKAYQARHDFLFKELQKIELFKCLAAEGTFYILVDVSAAMQKMHCASDVKFAELLLEKIEIALAPASVFGCDDCLRFSYATSLENLSTAIKRLKTLLQA